jgi:hypothetical protein
MVRSFASWLAALAACGFTPPGVATSDAPGADADGGPDGVPAFDPAIDCPATYTTQLASTAATSRYRVIGDLRSFWVHNAACNADRAGATHAVVLNQMQELLELKAHLDGVAVLDRYYLGGVQDPQATAANEGWIWFDGTPLLLTAWHTAEGEPNDNDAMGREGHRQQLVILDRRLTYLHDATGTSLYGIVCECDGKPVAATAQAFVAGDPNHPN